MDNKEWFKEAKFGVMVHFGLYSILGGEHRGEHLGNNEIPQEPPKEALQSKNMNDLAG